MSAVSREQAELEILDWLDYKKISQKKRDAYADNIESLVDAVVDGALIMDADSKVFTHKLKFPLKSEVSTEELEYKPRLRVGAIHDNMQGVKTGDADGRLCAYIAALTGKPKGIVKHLDTEDYSIAQSIALFFL